MKDRKILIAIVFVIIFNFLLVIIGSVAIDDNEYAEKHIFMDEFTSRIFVDNATGGVTRELSEMEQSFDSRYTTPSGSVEKGILIDDVNNVYIDSGRTSRRIFSDSIYTNHLSWEQAISLTSSSSADLTVNESKELATIILVLDKGGSSYAYSKLFEATGLVRDYLEEWYANPPVDDPLDGIPIETSISVFQDLLGLVFYLLLPSGVEDATKLVSTATGGFAGLDLFYVENDFTYTETINGKKVEVTYDFSKGLTKEHFEGTTDDVSGETTTLGINNWDGREVGAWFKTMGINTDMSSDGDLQLSLSFPASFRIGSEVYHDFVQFSNKKLEEYRSYDNGEGEDYGVYYKWYSPKKSAVRFKKWSFNDKKINKVDTEGEAFLYTIYKGIDYHEYFDKALEVDGLDAYEQKYIPALYGNANEFVNPVLPLAVSDYQDELDEIINSVILATGGGSWYLPQFYNGDDEANIIYAKGQKEDIEFGEFVLICRTYRPFLRTVNYEWLLWDYAGLMYNE